MLVLLALRVFRGGSGSGHGGSRRASGARL
jgi:hypothetical protein